MFITKRHYSFQLYEWIIINDYSKMEEKMRKVSVVLAFLVVLCLSVSVFAADKAAIGKNVDDIVAAIDGGKSATDFKADGYTPYIFIMEEAGKMIIHPSLAGDSIKEKAGPVYDALVKATPEGVWVDYEWQGKQKHSYVRKTKDGLIVGSGYSE